MKYFIEIGSNSYDTLVDLCKEDEWIGVLVEPLKKYFDKIEKVHNCFYENIAITENGGKYKFYYYDHPSAAGWGTLEKDHLKKLTHLSSNDPICVEVDSMTIKELFNKYKFPQIDYLKIDTESYDAKIIKSIDFNQIEIKKIKFEIAHLSIKEIEETLEILKINNFKELIIENDNAIVQK